MVSCVPGSPMDCAAMTPTASPISTEFAGGEVASVTTGARPAAAFAGQHGANFDALDSGGLNLVRQLFADFLVDVNDDVAFVVADLVE